MSLRPPIIAAGVYALALALVGLWPKPVDSDVNVIGYEPVARIIAALGLNPYQGYDLIEGLANIALFIPFGVLVLLIWPSWRWWQAVALAFATTVTIEVLQQLLRPERFASVEDVVNNTLGGAIGAAAVVVGRRYVRR